MRLTKYVSCQYRLSPGLAHRVIYSQQRFGLVTQWGKSVGCVMIELDGMKSDITRTAHQEIGLVPLQAKSHIVPFSHNDSDT